MDHPSLPVMIRIRKVKCDEGRPACHRCVSSGRVCDGYSIWGGGGSCYRNQQSSISPKERSIGSRPPTPSRAFPILAINPEDKGYFEWFKCRTVPKIPGSFDSRFWNTLLFQASSNEPAVLHAVLALSSVHKRGTISDNGRGIRDAVSGEQEQMTLKHYVKAIGHLQSHCSTRDRASARVALITCIVFVCLEFLRGHFTTAQTHLLNGLKVLGETQMLSNNNDGILRIKSSRESADDWIIEVFTRLHLQVELFKHTYHHPCLILQAAWPENPVTKFHTINEAWQHMERLLNRAFFLAHLGRERARSDSESPESRGGALALLGHQQRLVTELGRWPGLYEAFVPSQDRRSNEEEKGYHLLYSYHTMVTIIAETCLQPDDELVFDSHTAKFILLVEHLVQLRSTAETLYSMRNLSGQLVDMARSIVDMGWVSPLYYVATKCRVHRIRLQAVRLLETTSHREGMWDARTAASVARKVMNVEERDFYKDINGVDDFLLPGLPCVQDLSLPTLPDSYRIRELEVVLSGAPMDRILLFCKQSQEGIGHRVLLSEYDTHSQSWVDRNSGM